MPLRFALFLAGATAMAWPAAAQTPAGDWLVADGEARVRIVDCGESLWGVVSWTKTPGGRDTNNPEPAQRSRPILGMPVLLHMRPGEQPATWEGEVYNAENGRTYDATIALRSADILHIEGCTLGVLCGGEDWTRIRPAGAVTTGSGPAHAPAQAVCSRLPAGPGRSHENGLEQDRGSQRTHQR